jgi:4-oxalocrotonate tautomerase
MPYVNVRMLDDSVTQQQRDALIAGITSVFVDLLGRKPESVWVVIDEIPLASWGIGGKSVASRRNEAP